MFKELLPALYKRDLSFYSKLTPEQRTAFSPFVTMRWLSCVQGNNSATQLSEVNNQINIDFSSVPFEHKELIFMHMAVVANSMSKTVPRHAWITPPRAKGKNQLQSFLSKHYPDANSQELALLETMHSDEDLVRLLKDEGNSDKEIKEKLKSFRKG